MDLQQRDTLGAAGVDVVQPPPRLAFGQLPARPATTTCSTSGRSTANPCKDLSAEALGLRVFAGPVRGCRHHNRARPRAAGLRRKGGRKFRAVESPSEASGPVLKPECANVVASRLSAPMLPGKDAA